MPLLVFNVLLTVQSFSFCPNFKGMMDSVRLWFAKNWYKEIIESTCDTDSSSSSNSAGAVWQTDGQTDRQTDVHTDKRSKLTG